MVLICRSFHATQLIRVGLITVLVLAVGACGNNEQPTTSTSVPIEPVEVAPINFVGYASAEVPTLAVGQAVPPISGTTIVGAPFIWTPKVAPTVIVFLAHWCPACQNEVAELTDWLDTGNSLPAGVDFFGISTLVNSERDNYPPSQWLKNQGWPFQVMVDDANSTLAGAFGLNGTPFWAVIDQDGLLVSKNSGQIHPDNLSQLFQQLTEQPTT